MQSSSTSCHFLPLGSKYSPQHLVLKYPQYYCGVFQVQYKLQTSGSSPAATGNLTVKRGTMKSCVSVAGTYEFVPVGCHGYPQPSVQWNSMTAPTSSIQLMAVTHTMRGRVLSMENVKDMFIDVLSSEDGKLKTR